MGIAACRPIRRPRATDSEISGGSEGRTIGLLVLNWRSAFRGPYWETNRMREQIAPSRLRGQFAVVTGGGRGIGRTFAKALASAGATVAVIGRAMDDLQETVRQIET